MRLKIAALLGSILQGSTLFHENLMTSLTLTNLAWTPWATATAITSSSCVTPRCRCAAGEFVGLIGPNGSGKTSLLRCAYRFSQPENGEVKLDHHNVWKQSSRWCAKRIAVVLQEFPDAFGLTVEEVVAMGRTPHKGLFDGDTLEDQKSRDRKRSNQSASTASKTMPSPPSPAVKNSG